jgi:hypothetical protein
MKGYLLGLILIVGSIILINDISSFGNADRQRQYTLHNFTIENSRLDNGVYSIAWSYNWNWRGERTSSARGYFNTTRQLVMTEVELRTHLIIQTTINNTIAMEGKTRPQELPTTTQDSRIPAPTEDTAPGDIA